MAFSKVTKSVHLVCKACRLSLLESLAVILGLLITALVLLEGSEALHTRLVWAAGDRALFSIKQSLDHLIHPAHTKPSEKIGLMQVEVNDQWDFWRDDELRLKLKTSLENFSGTIFSNLPYYQIAEDPILSPLLQKKNFVRNLILVSGIPDLEAEQALALPSNVPTNSRGFTLKLQILPRNLNDHGVEKKEFAFPSLLKDASSGIILAMPLFVTGSQNFLPTSLARFVENTHSCVLEVLSGSSARCGDLANISNPLYLSYYSKDFRSVSFESLLKQKDLPEILVLDVFDPSRSSFATLEKSRASTGEILATALSNWVTGLRIMRPSWLGIIEMALLWLGLLLFVVVGRYVRLSRTISWSIIILSIGFLFDASLYSFLQLRSFPLPLAVVWVFGAVAAIGTRAVRDFRERSLVEKAFAGYVSEDRLQLLLEGKETLSLSGRKVPLTIMILDIVGFSKLCKTLAPEQVFELMREFFSQVDPIIFKFGGFIDKKTGDGLLAVFGDGAIARGTPAHVAEKSVLSALAIQNHLAQLKFGTDKMSLTCRIGVNSGEVFIGNSGSEKHFNYTVLGDVVNFTQRLEAAAEVGKVFISEETKVLVEGCFDFKPHEIAVKGQVSTQRAYEVIPRSSRASP